MPDNNLQSFILGPMASLIRGIKTLNVPRIEDLPYATSPPVQFVYQSTATLNLGSYTWADTPSAFTPNRPVRDNTLYFFRHLTFAADISELDFTANIVTAPAFQTYLKSQANVMLFREPVNMVSFLKNWDFRFFLESQQEASDNSLTQDQILGTFRGSLLQGPGLVGKATITLSAIISAQEITQREYVTLFKKGYPKNGGNQ